MISRASPSEAKDWFSRLHYTGTAAGHTFFTYGSPTETQAMVAVGRGGNRYGVAEKFGLEKFPGNLEITRVACAADAPRNTASKAVAAVLRTLAAEGLAWVFTYADTAHGHHGGIYQALGAVYVGTDAKQWVNFELDGLRVSKRAVSGRFGHTRWPEVRDLAAEAGHTLRKVDWAPKHTYVLVCAATRRERKTLLDILAPKSLPYPKRGQPVVPTAYRNHRPK
jgi:hypothetical protein